MENKQIIIDGVDVSGCKHYENHTLYDCNETCEINGGIVCTKCKEHPNCYYKQLARAEQENKRLLEIINANPLKTVDIDSAFEIEKLKEQLKAKEQECEESKNKIEFMEGYIKTVEKARNEVEQQLDQLKAENDLYKNAHKTEQDRRRSYENALTEIKEIAKIEYPKSLFTETFVEVINHCPYFDCGNCKCLENKEKQNCGGFICSRKQSVYYQENTIYFKQILQKISECEVENAKN